MLNLIKKQGIGSWISLGTVLLSLIAVILYGAALGIGDGATTVGGGAVFLTASALGPATAAAVLGLVFLALAIVAGQFKFEGILGTVYNVVVGALRIIVPVLFIYALVYFVGGTVTGLAWTFFSNEELEVNPAAITAGGLTIVTLILFGISSIAAIVASFFAITKKVED